MFSLGFYCSTNIGTSERGRKVVMHSISVSSFIGFHPAFEYIPISYPGLP